MKKNLIIFGTRPEAIKIAPLVKAFQSSADFVTKVCVTAQHREMLDQVLDFFDFHPDYDLDLMKPNKNLYSLTADIITKLKDILEEFKPDCVFVHGDTTTTMTSSIAPFYSGAQVCHIEAGLRTFNKRAPFPEEMNRQVSTSVCDYHFAPTQKAKENLINENIDERNIVVTGNTVIDALFYSSERVKEMRNLEIEALQEIIEEGKKLILMTGHRRENHAEGFVRIRKALKEIAENNPEVQIIYPVHLNPNVQPPVYEILSGIKNVYLIDPLAYPAFVWLMNRAHLIITNSGRVQEEAPSFGKPVLVLRDITERPEAVEVGTVILVGTDKKRIVAEAQSLLTDSERYNEMSALHNPYGDGRACDRVVNFIRELTLNKDISPINSGA